VADPLLEVEVHLAAPSRAACGSAEGKHEGGHRTARFACLKPAAPRGSSRRELAFFYEARGRTKARHEAARDGSRALQRWGKKVVRTSDDVTARRGGVGTRLPCL
jgi:hypothetical protein